MGYQDRDYNKGRRRPSDDDDHGWRDDREDEDAAAEDFDDRSDDETDVDDPNAPDASDRSDGDEPGFVRCPNCRRMISEEAEQCPRCGYFVEEEAVAKDGKPWWVWLGMGLSAILALMYAIGRW